jgi:hypothetical protein
LGIRKREVKLMSDEYTEISTDWRHRDNLTWQIPSLLSAIAGGLVAAAYAIELPSPENLRCVRLVLLSIAVGLSACLTFALGQNIRYQIGSGIALEKLRQGVKIPKEKLTRAIRPMHLGATVGEILRRLLFRLTGSTLLLILCLEITACVTWLFIDVWRGS